MCWVNWLFIKFCKIRGENCVAYVVKTSIITEKLRVVIVKMAVTRVEYNFLAVSFSTIKSSKNVFLSKDTIHESAKLIIITISKVITLYTAGINQKLSLIFSHAFERFINKILHLCNISSSSFKLF